MKNYLKAFINILNFKGNTSIKEFWTFFGITILINILFRALFLKNLISGEIYNTYGLISLLAFVSCGFRRLKDAGFSGFLILIPLINLILAGYPSKNLTENNLHTKEL